jgi:hypothetical protein
VKVRPLLLFAFALLPASGAAAQTVGPVGPPAPVTAKPKCQPSAPDDEEIVVCGERYDENSPYRVPQQFRNQRSDDDRDASFAARQRDLNVAEQWSSQNIGASGGLQNIKQRECEWRVARQEAQGRRPDCTRRNRPDEATDWQQRR